MTTESNDVVQTQIIVDGEWRPPLKGQYYDVFNPARPDELVGRAAQADADDVDAACKSAHKAFPAWAALSYHERAEYLKKVAENLTADEDELRRRIHLFTREHGKILKEAGIEMSRLGDRFLSVASWADRLSNDDELPGPPFDTIITHQPRGVAALIVPWNWPLSILGAKLPQALMAGNTVVVKFSKESPMGPALTVRKMAEMLPPGVINLVTGSSSRIGDPLLVHPLVRKINFTGGVDTGKHIMTMAAGNLTPVTLELGGNDAALVLDDAELDEAALRRMVTGSFLTTGQVCMALKRLYVHRSRFDELVEGFTKIVDEYVVGDGTQQGVTMGPVNNKSQQEFVHGLIEDARAAGADVRALGTVPDQDLFDAGYFIRPTVIVDADPQLRAVREEQFGPVLPILSFESDEEAIAAANDSEFGLCSSVWTPDKERAFRVARQLEAGYTYINGHGPMAQDNRAPFGGFKHSGIGRNLGYEGILAFQECHALSATPGWIF